MEQPAQPAKLYVSRLTTPIKNICKASIRLIYPSVCAGCGRLTQDHRALCAQCWQSITFIERPFCEVLGLPFSHDLGANILSAQAIANPPIFNRLRAAALHSGIARRLTHALKYKDRTDLAIMMGDWMVRACDGFVERADFIIPVPLHRNRLLMRKYNQAAELARQIALRANTVLLPDALIRQRNTARQVGLKMTARQDNMRGAFKVTDQGKSDIFGSKVVLVDDVYTTGATVGAACKVLKSAGAADITVLTFAMALSDIT